MLKKFLFLIVAIQFTACAELANLGGALLGGGGLTANEAGMGLKEALTKGVLNGVQIVGQRDGYFMNQAIRLAFPPDAIKVKNTLDAIPGGKLLTDNVVEKLNRAAEDAAGGAKTIFVGAIKQMTINDAMNILMGENNAATSFFKRTTTTPLYNSFNPVIKNSLSKVKALDAWSEVITRYNKIPFIKKVNPSMDDYVTNKAIDGLFVMIEKEEVAIRKDPGKRTSDLLKKVFAAQDNK